MGFRELNAVRGAGAPAIAWSPVTTLFALTVFASAFLLFALEPMFSKMLLPLFGGSPAVWNTSLVFYQLVLLAGYAYADLLRRNLTIRRQTFVHCALVIVAFLFLPTVLPGWVGDPTKSPVLSLLRIATATVALPFFVLAANSSLLQAWFARLRPQADAYALYAASNLGSMLGLVAYTFAFEPFTGLTLQSRLWQSGFLLFAVLLAGCVFVTLRRRDEGTVTGSAVTPDDAGPAIAARRIVRWIALAAVPSSLMLGVTAYLQDEVAAIPLLWTLPLALYLGTFVIAFGLRRFVSRVVVGRAAAFGLVAIAFFMAGQAVAIELAIGLNVVVFFLLALYCHTTLRDDRPPEGRLTQFYLWLAVGGAIGGMFNALIAPQIFALVIEYPLALVVGALLLRSDERGTKSRTDRIWDVGVPLIVGAAMFLFIAAPKVSEIELGTVSVFALAGFVALSAVRHPLRFGLVLAVMFGFALYLPSVNGELYHARDFFGVKHVLRTPTYHWFTHGATLHGAESTLIPHEREPLTYFERSGPVGAIFAHLQPSLRRAHVAVAGLGIGTLACYAQSGQTWTFYEIDPQVAQIATDSNLFRYISACLPKARIVLGDARLSLTREARHEDALLILDAYTSDQIPVHLLTREAFAIYLKALTPHGVLAFDISNVFFDLRSVIGTLAANAGLVAYDRLDAQPDGATRDPGWSPSHWVVVARSDNDLAGLERESGWHALPPSDTIPLWTDDYTSQIRILTRL
jgi:hypothetical protein